MSSQPRRTPTQALLFLAYDVSARELTDVIRNAGHPALRPKHGAFFATIDREGTRATTLAARAGMTKAAMGELVDELERLGYLERQPDASDRRAKLLVPTSAALDVLDLVGAFHRRWEARYRRILGGEAYGSLREALWVIASGENAGRATTRPANRRAPRREQASG